MFFIRNENFQMSTPEQCRTIRGKFSIILKKYILSILLLTETG